MIPHSLRVWTWPLAFGLLVYVAIDSYAPLAFIQYNYNRQVAGYVFVAAATLLLFAVFDGQRFQNVRPVIPWAVALALSVAISTWRAPNLFWSVDRDHLYYAVCLLGISLYLTHREDDERIVLRYFIVVPVVHMIFLVYMIFWLVRIQSEPDVIMKRLPDFANIRHFAYHGFVAAACATSVFAMSRKFEVTAFVLTTASLFGIILFGARGAFRAWAASALCMLLFHGQRARLLVFCISALAVSAGAVYYLTETGLLQVTSLFSRFGSDEDSAFRMSDRIGIWIDALRAIMERPLLGYGPEGFLGSRCCNPAVAQPHNFILQFLLELGFIGAVLLVTTAWAAVRACGGFSIVRTNLASDSGLLAVCAVLAGFLAYAMIDGLLYHAIPLVHFALFAALLFVTMTRLSRNPREAGCEVS